LFNQTISHFRKQNAFCGDHLHLTLQIKDNLIQDAKFDGAMCFVSIIGAN
jgi:NifU-like protein involved in Fe-S cluster formation